MPVAPSKQVCCGEGYMHCLAAQLRGLALLLLCAMLTMNFQSMRSVLPVLKSGLRGFFSANLCEARE